MTPNNSSVCRSNRPGHTKCTNPFSDKTDNNRSNSRTCRADDMQCTCSNRKCNHNSSALLSEGVHPHFLRVLPNRLPYFQPLLNP
mmetsp:Transcript_15024/g.23949  ORF Transcript_15024/g.23949 Transcript_15024/m.23949 type:complete len:85 (-) Transcript_15024:360-614(-)